jgi:hypothetical protein
VKRIETVVLALALLGVAACNSSTLTRSKAKTLIEGSRNYSPTHLNLTEQEIGAGLKSNYLAQFSVSSGYNILTHGPLFTRTYVKVGPDGEKYFDCPCKTAQQFEAAAISGRCAIATVATVQPHVIEVTGITDVPDAMGGGKLAQYTWNYDFDSLPSEIRDFFKSRQPQAWNARFRLYDDGWRLQEISR